MTGTLIVIALSSHGAVQTKTEEGDQFDIVIALSSHGSVHSNSLELSVHSNSLELTR